MDISIITINDSTKSIVFAGAMNSILKVSQGQINTVGGTNLPIDYSMEI